ncbi:MAG: hypothetical protein IT379_40275 [Deltaproteobacteria bacterium]|nr:hypothetical protein [Deltaproteobacteria bacterium]
MESVRKIALDGVPRDAAADLWRVFIDSEASDDVPVHLSVAPGARLRWDALDELPDLAEINYAGDDTGIIEYVRRRPAILDLSWRGRLPDRIDLAQSAVRSLALRPVEPSRTTALALPASLHVLELVRIPGEMTFACIHPRNGAGLIGIFSTAPGTGFRRQVVGLGQLTRLDLFDADTASVAAIADLFPGLEDLTLRGPPGKVADLANLDRLPKLRKLELVDCYELHATDLQRPLAVSLESLVVDGIRRDDAQALKRLVPAKNVELRGVRTPAWLAANVNNPFREWPVRSRARRVASKAYSDAVHALDRLTPHSRSETEAIVLRFIEALNAVYHKDGLDTLQAEDVFVAVEELVRGRGDFAVEDALALLERCRDF